MNRLLTIILLFFTLGLKAQYLIEADINTGCRPLLVNFRILPESARDTIISVLWDFGGGFPVSSELSPSNYFDTLGVFTVTCQVTTSNAFYPLIDRDTVIVYNCSDSLNIPNVFSPNDDNLNDRFYIDTDGTSVYSFRVFTRSGTLIYETESPAISWDGRSLSGQKMKQGIYYYVISRKDDVPLREVKGFVYLYE